MRLRRRGWVAGVVAVAVAVTSCGGDDDAGDEAGAGATTSTTTAAAITTAPPATDEPAPAAGVAESLDQFVVDWNAVNVTAAEELGSPGITVDPAAFAFGFGPNLNEAFAASVSDSVVLGGLQEPSSGRLTAVVLGADPEGESTPAAVATTFSFLGEPGGLEPLAMAYRDLATERTPGASVYLPSGVNDFVITVVAGAEAGDELIFVVAAPLSDEATATAGAELARQAVLNALLAAG